MTQRIPKKKEPEKPWQYTFDCAKCNLMSTFVDDTGVFDGDYCSIYVRTHETPVEIDKDNHVCSCPFYEEIPDG